MTRRGVGYIKSSIINPHSGFATSVIGRWILMTAAGLILPETMKTALDSG